VIDVANCTNQFVILKGYALLFLSVIRLHLTMDEANPKAVASSWAASRNEFAVFAAILCRGLFVSR
jgi:hypothetical protein